MSTPFFVFFHFLFRKARFLFLSPFSPSVQRQRDRVIISPFQRENSLCLFSIYYVWDVFPFAFLFLREVCRPSPYGSNLPYNWKVWFHAPAHPSGPARNWSSGVWEHLRDDSRTGADPGYPAFKNCHSFFLLHMLVNSKRNGKMRRSKIYLSV